MYWLTCSLPAPACTPWPPETSARAAPSTGASRALRRPCTSGMTPNTTAATTPATPATEPTTPQANASTFATIRRSRPDDDPNRSHSSRPDDRRANNVPITPVNSGTQRSLTDNRSPRSATSGQEDTSMQAGDHLYGEPKVSDQLSDDRGSAGQTPADVLGQCEQVGRTHAHRDTVRSPSSA